MAKVTTKLTPEEERFEKMRKLAELINKSQYGGDSHDIASVLGDEAVVSNITRFTTGNKAIDYAFGGGVPRNKIIELFGGESSGKSTLIYHIIANFQKKYPSEGILLIDTENCLAKGTLVYCADSGVYKSVEELCGKKFKVLSHINGENKVQEATAKKTGKKDVYLIRCTGGRKIRLTDNHRVLTQNGYVEVKDLIAGDLMYSPKKIPVLIDNKQEPNENLYRLLGYHIGDGPNNKASITSIDSTIIDDLYSIAKEIGDDIYVRDISYSFKNNNYKKYDIKKECLCADFDSGLLIEEVALKYGCHTDTVKERIREYGLNKNYNFKKLAAIQRNKRNTDIPAFKTTVEENGRPSSHAFKFLSNFDCFKKHSPDRRLPENLTINQLKQVIAGMYMTDGCVVDPEKQKRCAVKYGTTSRGLALDLQAALQKFGIFSLLCEDQKAREDGGYYRMGYVLSVNGYNDCSLFNQTFNLSSYKKERLEKALNMASRKKFNGRGVMKRDKELIPIEVLSVEHDGIEDVYDVSVMNSNDEEQNFLAEGVFIHNCYDPIYAENLGVNAAGIIYVPAESGIGALNIAKMAAESGGANLIIIDSIAALTTKSDENGEIGDQTMAEQARMVSQAFRVLNSLITKYDLTFVVTNQVRDNIGVMYGDKTTTPAGKALKHYAHIRAKLTRTKQIKDTKDNVIGIEGRLDCVKNKVAPPFRKAEYTITFGIGIDSVISSVNLAIEKGVIVKKGGWFNYDGQQIQGQIALVDAFRKDQAWLDKLNAEIEQRIAEASKSSTVKEQEKSDEETEKTEEENENAEEGVELI